jgi:hypothetical protein
LISENNIQFNLFDDTTKIEKLARIYSVVDEISEVRQAHIQHAASLPTKLRPSTRENG